MDLSTLSPEMRAAIIGSLSDEELISLPTAVKLQFSESERQVVERRIAPIAWRAGNLRYLLDDTQRLMLDAMSRSFSGQKQHRPDKKPVAMDDRSLAEVLASDDPDAVDAALEELDRPVSFFLLCARGNGKSWMLVAHAFEVALAKPEQIIYYVCPLLDDAIKIVTDIVNKFLLKECPPDLMPEWRAGDAEYHFHNGSIIRFRGTNNESVERMRGTGANFIVLDECGGMDRLKYVLQVVGPVAERWHGVIVLATTPAVTTDHESKDVFEDHAARGAAVKFTMLDNVRDTLALKARKLLRVKNPGERKEDIPLILAGKKLPSTTYALREYFCEFVTDTESAVVPEFTADREREVTVKAYKLPAYCDRYVAMDPGIRDRTGILYAHVDFLRGKLVIEDESLLADRDADLNGITDELRVKESALWHGFKPHKRISDTELRLLIDLSERGYVFDLTEKKDSDGAIRLMRTMLSGQIEIHERCVNLRRQLRGATWNKARTDFAKEPLGGHYDLVAALKYLCRAVNMRRNPYPPGWRDVVGHDIHTPIDRTPKKEKKNKTPFERRLDERKRKGVGFRERSR